jgi:hypothetical protein
MRATYMHALWALQRPILLLCGMSKNRLGISPLSLRTDDVPAGVFRIWPAHVRHVIDLGGGGTFSQLAYDTNRTRSCIVFCVAYT